MKSLYRNVLTGLVALGLGASAMAMPPAGGDMCNPDGPRQSWRKADPAKRAELMKTWMAKRHAAIHDKLKLNAEQETAWQAYIADATPPAMPTRMSRDEMRKLSAPERMEKMLSLMKEHQAHMEARLDALKKFYAVLTPEQQKIFDAEVGPHHRPFHKAGRRGAQHHNATAPTKE